MKNIQTVITHIEALNHRPDLFKGETFLVLETYDFSRDINGNTINKYRASLHQGDRASVEHNYTGCTALTVLTSPYRREQSHNRGCSMALWRLEGMGYKLDYVSMSDIGGNVQSPKKDLRRFRLVYRVTNAEGKQHA